MADQIVTNPGGGGGHGGLYFVVGAIVVALAVVVALFTGVFRTDPQTARNPAKEIDITIKPQPPAAPAPTK
ncbi:MAG: hypothetical protein KF889_18360 [Alphaproteobacteria bacterium]|nr:hypothetical protein [Alphaproteobacteria bacterium]MCW5743969.1 hypothetical protein [Alphaproteobacteria bacterium]